MPWPPVLPLAVGALAVVGTFLALRVLVSFTHVSIYSLNLTTAMGLGLAIDYSLFVVSRFREELHHSNDTAAAVVRTVQTAGRTVLFSAFAVATSLAALLVFPLYFLRSFAYAGVAVVAIAAAGAVIVLPALLAVLGPKVDRLRVWHRPPKEVGEGFWHRLAMTVMRRPLPIATAIVLVLVVLGAPFLKVNFGLPDDRVLPKGATSREGLADIRTKFTGNESSALSLVGSRCRRPGHRSHRSHGEHLRRPAVPAGWRRPGRRLHRIVHQRHQGRPGQRLQRARASATPRAPGCRSFRRRTSSRSRRRVSIWSARSATPRHRGRSC